MSDEQAFRYVTEGGKIYKVPANATPAQISAYTGAVPVENAAHVPANTKTWVEVGNDVLYGAAKGLANTTRNAVSIIPGVEPTARAVGNYLGDKAGQLIYGQHTEAPVSKQQVVDELKPANAAQKLGYGAEQVGEFFVPAGAARASAIENLVKMIPNNATPATMKVLNKVAAIAGRTIGEAGSAGTVATLQGSDNPAAAAAVAGAGPLVGVGAQAAAQTLKYPLTRQMAAILTGLGAMQMFGAVTPASLASGLAVGGVTRAAAKKFLAQPGFVQRLGGLARTGSEQAARLLATITAAAADDGKDED